MGYTAGEIRISVRAERHNCEQDRIDDQAIEDLKREIALLIESDPAYERVAPIGVWGGV